MVGQKVSSQATRHGDGEWRAGLTVDGDPRPFAGLALTLQPLLLPALQTNGPQDQRLQDGGFAGVVGANEHHGIPQGNLHVLKVLEIAGFSLGEHGSEPLL